ncbi:MAG: MCE family protein [Calditrichaeota bacterium]|nr:MCE family protein [Calditrichota bacterium]MBT7618506.1 MCE family protein [Calditrichota bacterium]MBT7787684.1 MCE family protein [Calditrichota bacterium]
MREITRAQKARLGMFLTISGSMLLIMLLYITGKNVFEKRDEYFIRYEDVSVSGVEVGAQVKYHGVRVGRVDKIAIDNQEVSTIIVEISLLDGTPVKTDVKAEITALSLTGLKIIELTGGSNDAALIPPGSEIPAGASPLQAFTGRVEAVSEKLEIVLSNFIELTGGENQEKLFELINSTALVLEDFHSMFAENRGPIENTITNLELASENVLAITGSPEITRTLTNLDSVTTSINQANLAGVIKDFGETFEEARIAINHIDLTLLKGRHDLLMSLEVLRDGLESFNEFSRLISEDPSLIWRGRQGGEIDPSDKR